MKSILVTGAAGFIGAAVAKQLIQNGNKVVTIDNLSTGLKQVIPDGCVFIEGDDFDVNVINQLYDYKFDVIIHIAGQSSGEVSFEDPVYDLQTNVQSTLMLLDYAQKTGCKEFIFASSMSVYGDHGDQEVDESSSTEPKSLYAVGKLACEHYMRIYSQVYGLKCTALRFFNVYGEGQNLDNLKQGMASIYLAHALQFKHITVKGSKDRFRDFVYITDVVDAVIRSIGREKGQLSEIYNVSNGKPVYVYEIIEYIKKYLSENITNEYIEGTLGDQKGVFGNSEKICKDLGWSPKITFDKGMKMMVDWALNNK